MSQAPRERPGMLGVSVIMSALVGVKASNLGAEVGHVSRWFFLSGPARGGPW